MLRTSAFLGWAEEHCGSDSRNLTGMSLHNFVRLLWNWNDQNLPLKKLETRVVIWTKSNTLNLISKCLPTILLSASSIRPFVVRSGPFSQIFLYVGRRLNCFWRLSLNDRTTLGFGYIWSFWLYFGYMVNGQSDFSTKFFCIWSFRLYGPLYQDKTVDHLSETRCFIFQVILLDKTASVG